MRFALCQITFIFSCQKIVTAVYHAICNESKMGMENILILYMREWDMCFKDHSEQCT